MPLRGEHTKEICDVCSRGCRRNRTADVTQEVLAPGSGTVGDPCLSDQCSEPRLCQSSIGISCLHLYFQGKPRRVLFFCNRPSCWRLLCYRPLYILGDLHVDAGTDAPEVCSRQGFGYGDRCLSASDTVPGGRRRGCRVYKRTVPY